MKKILNLILFIALTTFAVAQERGTEPPAKPRILGVVMGISKYQNVPSLRYADRDAMSFYNFLLSPAGGGADTNNIRLLLNEKATSYNFFEAMDNLLDMAKEGDQVYIYFAGHGDIEKKTDRQNGFLIGYNAPPNCYAAGGSISVRFLQDYVETLVSKNKSKVVLIVDACRSGKLAGGTQGAEITALALQAEWKGVTKILSCQPGETSLESENWGGGAGVFTYFMLRGLKGLADEDGDGKISVRELDNFLDKNVTKETSNKQIPEIVGDKRQDIAKVDKKTYLGILNQMEKPITLPTDNQSAGFKADVSSINDIAVLKEFEKFKYYINNNNLIAYNDKDNDKETALSIYRSLESRRSAQPIISKMKGELLAALQNKAQIILNASINNVQLSYSTNKDSIYKDSTYKDLKTAFSLVDSSSPQFKQIKYRYLLWKSFDEKDPLKEIALLEECIKTNPDEPFAYFSIGVTYNNEIKNKGNAIFYYDKAIELSNNWSIAWSNKGITLADMGKYEEAIKHHDKAIELKQDNAAAWSGKGFALQNLEKYEEAIKCYDKSIELGPDDYNPWFNKGTVLSKLGKLEEAIKSYDKSLEKKPDNYRAWSYKGSTLKYLGKLEDAIKCYDKAIELKPNDDSLWYFQGNIFNDLGKWDEAIKCYDKATVFNQNLYEAWVHKGMALNSKGKPEEAIRYYDKAIEINPKRIQAWTNKGYTLINLEKPEEAIKCCDKAIEINPGLIAPWINKSNALLVMGRFEEAMKCCDKAFEINPDDADVWFNKGNVFLYLGKSEEALKCFDKVLELNPGNAQALTNKGNLLFSKGKPDEAIKCFDRAIEINSQLIEPWINKAYALAYLGKIEEALKCYDKTLEINPKSWQAYGLKGHIKHIQKRYDDAINCQNKVLELNPNNVSSIYNIACAYSLLKNKTEMLIYLKKTIELEPKKYKFEAPKDEDFKEYWNDPDFIELVK